MSSERSLQVLYDQLFGADDRDADNTSHVKSDTPQADVCPTTRPVIFDRPAGLHLFKTFISQQHQVRVEALFLPISSTFPPLCSWCRKLSWHASIRMAG